MSGTDDRVSLADAASSVSGVTVHPYFVQGTNPGHGYVRLDRIERDQHGFGYVNHWNVIVILPQGQAAAERWLDLHRDALFAAIEPHMKVRDATPQRLNLAGVGDLLSVFINGHREE